MSDKRPKPSIVSSNRPMAAPVASAPIDPFEHFLPQLLGTTPEELKTLYSDMTEGGPNELLKAIEAELAYREIDLLTLEPVK